MTPRQAAADTVRPLAVRGTPRPSADGVSPSRGRRLDEDSRRWLHDLAATGHAHDDAVRRLHELLLRAARYEVSRRRHMFSHLRGGDHDDLAEQAAADALVAVLGKLDGFRGDSRFTTWAYKFALYEAAVKLRRRAWQARELPLEPDAWPAFASHALSPGEQLAESELLEALRVAITERLSTHQREVLVAITLNGIPIDVLAERLNTTRGALYKTLHDARKKLRGELAAQGVDIANGEWEHET
ncbi:MAG: sigma-70 family RNA polymerase sigma factor [Solirubrobacteraceae bacterium]|nr:sigma-70 family RNA polymerase sigma factor [Solirubrobacteraceae bacterium]